MSKLLPLLALAALVGCGASRAASNVSVTAADATQTVAPPSTEPPAQPTADAPAEAEDSEEPPGLPAPAGHLECRTKDAFGVVGELYVEWKEESAKGTLRTIGPSGRVTDRRLSVGRYGRAIIGDDLGSTDLIMHAAVVGNDATGSRFLQIDQDHQWSRCE